MADHREQRMFTNDSTNIPSELIFIMKDLAKDVIVENPGDITNFSKEWFLEKLAL